EQPCRLCVCCFSTPATYRYDKASRNFWKELCRNEGISFTDIDDVWQACRLTYFPCSDMLGNDHLTADGHLIYSLLLANQFIKDGIIPFKTPASR
ncbi:MAG TPA: hypothetical protein VN963_00745, partial [bacterium]|nr:hypothetical protein [bacterium]